MELDKNRVSNIWLGTNGEIKGKHCWWAHSSLKSWSTILALVENNFVEICPSCYTAFLRLWKHSILSRSLSPGIFNRRNREKSLGMKVKDNWSVALIYCYNWMGKETNTWSLRWPSQKPSAPGAAVTASQSAYTYQTPTTNKSLC